MPEKEKVAITIEKLIEYPYLCGRLEIGMDIQLIFQ